VLIPFHRDQAAEYGDKPDMESKHFAKTALPEILPVMLQLLLKQDEDADDDEWNISMAAGACIGLLAGVVSDAIVQPVIPFIEANIRADDWHQREAAVMAFGAILDGPDSDKLTPLVQQALPTLIGMMQDAHPAVKDTVAWTLGRITELMVEAIEPNVHLQGLIQALIAGLNDDGHGRIASNAAWAVKNLAQQIGGDLGYSQSAGMSSDAQSSMLSPFYNPLMETLMNVTNRWVFRVQFGLWVSFQTCSPTLSLGLPTRVTREQPRTRPCRTWLCSLPMILFSWSHELAKRC
jgi:importin subunit beta-1